MPCGLGPTAHPREQANLPVFAPQRLKQARGRPEPRIERLMDAMFFEVGRDERQLLDRFFEYRCHPSHSKGHEANSIDGARNLQLFVWTALTC
jgi:hypothetical protein